MNGTDANKRLWKRRLYTVLAVVAVIAGVVAYLANANTVKWKEEIQLSDGSRMVVERSKTYGGLVTPGDRHDPVKNWTIAFKSPVDKRPLHFNVQGGMVLMLVDFDKGVPYIVASPRRGDAMLAYGCPNPPFLFFKYVDSWKRIPPEQFPQHLTKANLPANTS